MEHSSIEIVRPLIENQTSTQIERNIQKNMPRHGRYGLSLPGKILSKGYHFIDHAIIFSLDEVPYDVGARNMHDCYLRIKAISM